ncbi:hypothetical protein OAL13_00120 [bacterium]|nr:hypothetical protein [bacterium]
MSLFSNILSLPGELQKLRSQLSSLDETNELRQQLEKTQQLLIDAQSQTGIPLGLNEAEQARWILEVVGKASPGASPDKAINRQLELIHIDRLNRWGNFGFRPTDNFSEPGHDGISETRLLECKSTTSGKHSNSRHSSLFEGLTMNLTEEQQERTLLSLMHHKNGEVITHVAGPLLDVRKLVNAKTGKGLTGITINSLLGIGFAEVIL